MSVFPGISFRYDPREPLPPEFHQVNTLKATTPLRHLPNHRVNRSADGRSYSEILGYLYPPRPEPYHLQHGASDTVRNEGVQIKGFFAPLSAAVKVQVVHDTANFVITHQFWNQSDAMREGTYQFPLPLEATVTDFNCRVEPNKIIRGEVKAKEDARADFENAVQDGFIAGLVEQQTADIFTTTLGNIPANTKIKAELSFVCLLKHRRHANQELFTLTLPTYIAPRYGAPPLGVKTSVEGPKSLSVRVDLLTTEELVSVSSDTHAIAVEKGSGQRPCQRWEDFASRDEEQAYDTKVASIQLEGCTALDRDLILDVCTALSSNVEVPHACLEVHPTFKNHKAVMVTVPSEFMLQTEITDRNGEVIFVADRSGSMSDKMASLKSAMMFFINGIPYGRPFNIWCFGSSFTSMWTHPRPLNEESKDEATIYVQQQFESNMGGTEILSVLQAVTQSRNSHAEMDVIVLTDGEVWRPSNTIDFVKQASQRSEGMIRFFSLGIGTAVSHELVEGIARAGGGYADIITSANHGGWEDRIVAVLNAALAGHIGPFQVELSWKDGSVTGNLPSTEYEQSPLNTLELSPFIRNRIYLLFDREEQRGEVEAMILKAKGPNGIQVSTRVEVIKLHRPDSVIHKLAARALLHDLEEGKSKLHTQNHNSDVQSFEKHVRSEAIKLGCKWSLVSLWTSIVAVEYELQTNTNTKGLDFELATLNTQGGDQLLEPRGPFGSVLATHIRPMNHRTQSVAKTTNRPETREITPYNFHPVDMSAECSIEEPIEMSAGLYAPLRAEGSQKVRHRHREAATYKLPPVASRRISLLEVSSEKRRLRLNSSGSITPDMEVDYKPKCKARTLKREADYVLDCREIPSVSSSSAWSPMGILSPKGFARERSLPLAKSSARVAPGAELRYTESSEKKSFGANSSWTVSLRRYASGIWRRLDPSPVTKGHRRTLVSFFKTRPATVNASSAASSSEQQLDPSISPSGASHENILTHPTKVPTANTQEDKLTSGNFIRTILPFQKADGSFVFQRVATIDKQLGPLFMDVVSKLAAEHANIDLDKAVTIALIVLLEEKFQNCQSLWQLMVRKAREYIVTNCKESGTLLQKARGLMEPVEVALEKAESQDADVDTSVELKVAPIS